MQLRAGDVLHLTRAASVQFHRPIMFRLIRVKDDWTTFDGWVWLDGYELDKKGNAVARRSVFVQWAGLRVVPQPRPLPPTQNAPPAQNGPPAQTGTPIRNGRQYPPNSRRLPSARP
nr:hypothetical protein [Micromonospora pallida]